VNALATGPKTPEGKARAAKNATRHGLLSRDLVLSGESRRQLDTLRASLVDTLRPVGELELLLVERAVSCVWRLRRLLRLEVELVERDRWSYSGEDHGASLAWVRHEGTFNTMNRYEVTLERSLYRALHELERAQAARQGKAVPLPQVLDVDVSGPCNQVQG
jgi:hypothetical protein